MSSTTGGLPRIVTERVPPQVYFVNSAVFHYLGPAFAVLLFVRIDVLGVAWLRIASAAAVFLLWRHPWRVLRASNRPERWRLVGMGVVLGGMNTCFGFMLYTIVGHRLAADGGASGVDRLGAAMIIALVAVSPLGLVDAVSTLGEPLLLLAGLGVGICSSVIPYVCDQLAMARLPRATFSLMLALLPALATVIGVVVLHQIPSTAELAGVGLIIAAVAVHRARDTTQVGDELT